MAKIIKKTNNFPEGTSFHGDVVRTSKNELVRVLGYPTDSIDDVDEKVQNEWQVETSEGVCGFIYDWKEYCRYKDTARIGWHIGAKNPAESRKIKVALQTALAK